MNPAEPTLTIRDLRLRVPGLSRDAARQLGEAVARELAKTPPAVPTSRDLRSLDLRVHASPAHGTSRLAAQIAASLRRSLQ